MSHVQANTLNCPICDTPLDVGRPGDVARLGFCPGCGLAYTIPAPGLTRPLASPRQDEMLTGPGRRPPYRRRWAKRAALHALGRWGFRTLGIAMPPRNNARALDVGCGVGYYVRALRDLGWRAWGVERSPDRAARANIIGRGTLVADAHDLPFSAATFDALFLWHVLEHLSAPLEGVREARRLLVPGGILLIEVPNLRSLQARVFGPRWLHLAWDVHYWHFTARHLYLLLEKAGFTRVRTWSVPNAAGWTDSAGIPRIWTGLFYLLDGILTIPGWGGAIRAMAE